MKRDMDLVRTILLEVENLPFDGQFHPLKLPNYSQDGVCYHVLLAQDAGLLEARHLKGTSEFMVGRLTYDGHEFLDASRDDIRWNRAKEFAIKNAGTLTLEGMRIALGALIKQALTGAA